MIRGCKVITWSWSVLFLIETPYSTGSSWRPLSITYFHSILIPFWFIGFCLLLPPVYHDVDHVVFVLDLHIKYTVHVVVPDDLERSMDYELSLLPKVVSLCISKHIIVTCPCKIEQKQEMTEDDMPLLSFTHQRGRHKVQYYMNV